MVGAICWIPMLSVCVQPDEIPHSVADGDADIKVILIRCYKCSLLVEWREGYLE
jgi:hypothetical protein